MDRKLKILIEIVDQYIKTGEPVGSKAIADMMGNSVSSATIRNYMAAFSDMGYLEQPHISAGRVPTAAAYRVYVNWLMAQKPSDIDKNRIYAAVERMSSERISESAGKLLSDVTGCVILSLANAESDPISCIQVLQLGHAAYIVLLVTQSGQVSNQVVRCVFIPDAFSIARFVSLANDAFSGRPPGQVTKTAVQRLGVQLGELFMQLAPFLAALFEAAQAVNRQEVMLIGQNHLFGLYDTSASQIRDIMLFFSDRQGLSRLLERSDNSITVTIGPENEFPQLSGSTVLTANYGGKGKTYGKLGVIAPVRSNYKSLISQLACLTEAVSDLLNQLNDNKANQGEEK